MTDTCESYGPHRFADMVNAARMRRARFSERALPHPDEIAAMKAAEEARKQEETDRKLAAWLDAERTKLRAWACELAASPANERQPAFFHELLQEVCRYYNVTPTEVRSRRRTAKLVNPRQVISYIASREILLTLPQIGRLLGGRDHTTILHGVRKVEAKLKADDKSMKEAISAIQLKIQERVLSRGKDMKAMLA